MPWSRAYAGLFYKDCTVGFGACLFRIGFVQHLTPYVGDISTIRK